MRRLGVKRARAYAIVDQTARTRRTPRHIAALLVASDAGIAITNFATDRDYEQMQKAEALGTAPAVPAVGGAASIASAATPKRVKAKPNSNAKAPSSSVFVVHGRNDTVRKSLFALLRSLGLKPLEWNNAVELTKKGSPYNGEVLDAAFRKVRAVVVLFTPDDMARLKPEFLKPDDQQYERTLTGQARPNVLFEAGMAFGRHPDSTVLVRVGTLRDMSDVAGRQLVHLTNSPTSRRQLVSKLRAAGCAVDDTGEDWLVQGDFSAV
jgi:predicted nucleotide-binding protein